MPRPTCRDWGRPRSAHEPRVGSFEDVWSCRIPPFAWYSIPYEANADLTKEHCRLAANRQVGTPDSSPTGCREVTALTCDEHHKPVQWVDDIQHYETSSMRAAANLHCLASPDARAATSRPVQSCVALHVAQ